MIEERNIQRIIDAVDQSSIESKEMKDDLVDHFCCLIEIDMKEGIPFEKAYERAYLQTCPSGLNEIQKETTYLLNRSKMVFMKRLTYLTGFLLFLSSTIGGAFKILHLPGARVLMAMGSMGLVFVFLPLLFYKRIAHKIQPERIMWKVGLASVCSFALAALFKILHFPGFAVLMALSILLLSFGFLPLIFFKVYEKSVNAVGS